jgi:hypothetical protein
MFKTINLIAIVLFVLPVFFIFRVKQSFLVKCLLSMVAHFIIVLTTILVSRWLEEAVFVGYLLEVYGILVDLFFIALTLSMVREESSGVSRITC